MSGHLILLFSCLQSGVCKIFEAHLKDENPHARNITYDVKQLFHFIDSLPDFVALVYGFLRFLTAKLFSFSNQTSAYLPKSKDWIKTKVLAHLKKMAGNWYAELMLDNFINWWWRLFCSMTVLVTEACSQGATAVSDGHSAKKSGLAGGLRMTEQNPSEFQLI